MSSIRAFLVIFTICACGISSSFGQSLLSIGNGFVVTMPEFSENGTCKADLLIVGNGIQKRMELKCPATAPSVINLNNALLVTEGPSSVYYSGEPSVLVHVSDDKCVKEVFTDKDGKTSSEEKEMSQEDCTKVKDKIEVLKQQQKELESYMAQIEQQVHQQVHQEVQQQVAQVEQVQQNIQALQNQLPGFPFGKK